MEGVTSDFDVSKFLRDNENSWKFVPAKGNRPAYYVYTIEVQKSGNDDREYRVVRLENGLEAVLVHDEKADKSAACLDVAVGDFLDPEDMPGLAHFCEHLLFMGTKQYPKENEYDEYLTKNNGEGNAFTSACDTIFLFSVAADAFEGALRRFSAFFHSPLFSESCVMRELNAMDSENSISVQDDDWRLCQTIRHLARSGHPLRKCGTGSKKTLMQGARSTKMKNVSTSTMSSESRDSHTRGSTDSAQREEKKVGLEVRRRVIEWWSKEYCASRMKLAVIGKDSLDELTHLVTTLFSPIVNCDQDPLPRCSEYPFGKDEPGSIVYVKTVSDINGISIMFPIPDQTPLWHVKPADFLAHLIGHEGPGSLHAYLKNKGWIIGLETDAEELLRGSFSFNLSMDLTKDGFKNYREVIQTCFRYISLLRSSPLPKWFQDERTTLDALEFRFDENISSEHYACHIASFMELPMARALVLSGPRLTWAWDEQLVKETLEGLRIENSIIVIPSQDHSLIGKDGPWKTEPWFGTKYMVEKLDDKLISTSNDANDTSNLSLPRPNEFVPGDVEVEKIEVTQPKKRPALIKRTPLVDVWFKKDDQFWTPRAQVVIGVQTPVANSSASGVIMTRIFAYLVEDALSEYSYDAALAGLFYDFGATPHGFTLSVGGYNDKLHILAQHVLEKAKSLEICEDRLELMKEMAQQELANALLSEPNMLARYYLCYLLVDREFTVEEQLTEVPLVTTEKLKEHIRRLLLEFKLTVLVNGNLRRTDASRIASMAERTLGAKAVPKNLVPARSRLLPKGCNYVWELPVPNSDETNSCVSYYCHIGRYSDARLRVVTALLVQLLCEPAFDILRTKEQVAYLVTSDAVEDVESLGWRILVQSERDPGYVETRIEAFLQHMRGVLEKMPEDEFEEHKASLIHELSETLKNIMEETSRFWSTIRSGYLNFQRRERDVELLKSVDKKQVIDAFNKFLDPASPTRSKLSVHMRTQNPSPPKLSPQASEKFLTCLQKADVAVDEDEFASLCEELHVGEARGYWEEALQDQLGSESRGARKLLEEFDELVRRYPQEGYEAVELDAKVVFIKDGVEFRQSLALSGAAVPVEEYEVE